MAYMLINSLAGGGAEKVAVNIYGMLNIEKFFLLEKEVKYKVPEEKLEFLSEHTVNTNPIIKTFCIPLYASRLSRYIQKESIVISMLERANYVNMLTSLFKRHKAIVTVHMSQKKGRKSFHPYNLITRILYPRALSVVCVSKAIARELEMYYGVPGKKLRVIYNPVDIEKIQVLSKEDLGIYSPIFESTVVISIGRLTKPKGQWYLLRVFRRLLEFFPDIKLVILGDGELKNYLVNLSEKLKLKTYVWDRDNFSDRYNVYFLGFQENPYKFLARAKLLVFPSLWEGFGNVIVESLACSIPVVSSDCRSGPREILAPDTDFEYQTREPEYAEYGILMPVFEAKFKDADEPFDEVETIWIETLRKVLSDDGLLKHYSQKAKARAVDFHIDKIAEEWKKLFRELEMEFD